MTIIDKLKEKSFISIIIICSVVISTTVSITSWFYERQKENIISKYEADIARIKNVYEFKIKQNKNTSYSEKQPIKDEPTIAKTNSKRNELRKQKVCEIVNPKPDKDVHWEKTELEVDGVARYDIDAVWLVVKPSDKPNKACSCIRVEVDDNGLWRGKVKLMTPGDQDEYDYDIFVFPDSKFNSSYFKDVLKQKVDSKSFFKLPDGGPQDYSHFITVKRINK